MPGHLRWADETKTILLHIYEGDLSLADYYAIIDANYAVIDSVPHVVHTILDQTRALSRPDNLALVLYYTQKRLHPRQGWCMVIAHQPRENLTLELGQRITPRLFQRVRAVGSLEQALCFLREHTNESTY